MGKLPWFPCYAGDWLASERISAMSIEEEGAYHRLLCHAWLDKSCSIPADEISLRALSRLKVGSLTQLLACFEPHPRIEGRLHNKRLTTEWKRTKEIQQERVKSGKLGADVRWHSKRHSVAIATPMANDSYSQSQSQEEKKEKKQSVVHTVDKSRTRIPGEADWQPIGEALSKLRKGGP